VRSTKSVVLRPRALLDVDEALAFYLSEASEQVALGFIGALEDAYRLIGEQPAVGSLRYAHRLDLPDLRSWPLKRYPYVLFYVERPDDLDVWRLLHAASDVPAWLAETSIP
jgi:toxin ParE1/3/4